MPERELPLFPLHVVLFPGMRLPLHIFEDRYKLMIGTCMVTDETFGVVLIRSGQEVGGPAEVFRVGTTARIASMERLPEGRMNLVVVGGERFRIVERLQTQPYLLGSVELLPDVSEAVPDGLSQRVARRFRRQLLGSSLAADKVEALRLPEDPLRLSHLVAAGLKVPARQRQRLLEEDSATTRLRRELAYLEWSTGGPPEANARSFSIN